MRNPDGIGYSLKNKLVVLEKDIYSYLRSGVSSIATKKHLLKLLITTLLEASVILGSVYAGSQFIDDEKGAENSPFIGPSLLLLSNFLLRTPDITEKHVRGLLVFVRGIIFSLMNAVSRTCLFHEGGHALTALSLFKQPKLHISLSSTWYGFNGGNTYFSAGNGLTQLGELFGKENSHIITSAAGAGEIMLESYLELIVAQCLSDEFLEIKTSLRLMVLANLIYNLYYALSEYLGCDKIKGHDFCKLDEAGFPPYAASLLMCGSLLALQIMLSATSRCYRYAKNKCSNREIEDIRIDEEDYQTININEEDGDRITEEDNVSAENRMQFF